MNSDDKVLVSMVCMIMVVFCILIIQCNRRWEFEAAIKAGYEQSVTTDGQVLWTKPVPMVLPDKFDIQEPLGEEAEKPIDSDQ